MLNASEICHRCYDGLESVLRAGFTAIDLHHVSVRKTEREIERENAGVCMCACTVDANTHLYYYCVGFRSPPTPHRSSCWCVCV